MPERVMLLLCVHYLCLLYFTPLAEIYTAEWIVRNASRMIVAAIAVMALSMYREIIRLCSKPILWGIAFAIAGSFSVLMQTVDPTLSVYFYYQLFSRLLVYLLFLVLAFRTSNLRVLVSCLILLAIMSTAVSVYGVITGTVVFDLSPEFVGKASLGMDIASGRVGGLRGENYVGVWVAPALVVGLTKLLRARQVIWTLPVTCAVAVSIAASLSRTSVVCGFVAICMVVFLALCRGGRFSIMLFVIGAFILLFTVQLALNRQMSLLSDDQYSHQVGRWTGVGDLSSGRVEIWQAVIDGIFDNPFIGQGPMTSIRQYDVVGHNAFLDVCLDFGLIGLAIFVLPIIIFVWHLVRNVSTVARDEYLSVLYPMWLAMICSWMFLSAQYSSIIWIVMALLHGRLIYVKETTHLVELSPIPSQFNG